MPEPTEPSGTALPGSFSNAVFQGCYKLLVKLRMLGDPHLTVIALFSDISGNSQSSVSFPALLVPTGLVPYEPMHQFWWSSVVNKAGKSRNKREAKSLP